MFSKILNIFGIAKPAVDYHNEVKNGALIIDVRTKGEYSSGHIKGSINIPVESLHANLSKIKDKDSTIITCCASGMRSASAKHILKSKGFKNVHNGGAWHSLHRKINK